MCRIQVRDSVPTPIGLIIAQEKMMTKHEGESKFQRGQNFKKKWQQLT
jgi:hypothetical protein